MVCPNCSTKQPDDADECSVCGEKLKTSAASEGKDDKSKKVHVNLKKKTKPEPEEKNSKNISKKDKKFKIIAVGIGVVLIIVIAIIISVSMMSDIGMKNTRKLAKKIGEDKNKAYSSAKLSDDTVSKSDFEFLNVLAKGSDSIIESDKQVSVSGVVMPKWAIFCMTDSFGKLTDVSYYDFEQLQNNMNGCKKKGIIDTSPITNGTSEKEAEKILDMEPYITQYSSDTVTKTYKYYYKDKQTKSINAYYIRVLFSRENNTVIAPVVSEKNDYILDILETGLE